MKLPAGKRRLARCQKNTWSGISIGTGTRLHPVNAPSCSDKRSKSGTPPRPRCSFCNPAKNASHARPGRISICRSNRSFQIASSSEEYARWRGSSQSSPTRAGRFRGAVNTPSGTSGIAAKSPSEEAIEAIVSTETSSTPERFRQRDRGASGQPAPARALLRLLFRGAGRRVGGSRGIVRGGFGGIARFGSGGAGRARRRAGVARRFGIGDRCGGGGHCRIGRHLDVVGRRFFGGIVRLAAGGQAVNREGGEGDEGEFLHGKLPFEVGVGSAASASGGQPPGK